MLPMTYKDVAAASLPLCGTCFTAAFGANGQVQDSLLYQKTPSTYHLQLLFSVVAPRSSTYF